jgi:ATP-dependent exoDNAse (exonuclease V) beta subunit
MDLVGDKVVVRDLVSLTLALRYPHDRLHWLSLLRAPFVGLTLENLHSLTQSEDKRATIVEQLRDPSIVAGLCDDASARIERFLEVIEPALKQASRGRLMPWVEAVWLRLGGPVACKDELDRDGAKRAIQLLYELEARNELWNKSTIESAIGRLYANATDTGVSQIQVMTLHKSKGLEFDTVILPALDRKPRGDTAQLLNWFELTIDEKPQLLLAPFEQSGLAARSKGKLIKLVKRAGERCDDEEKLRLLYVACTRAKRHLHLVANATFNSKGE